MGRVFNAIAGLLVVRGVRDTQCGFKCFRGDIASGLFQRQKLDGFAFDVEILFLARKSGLTMKEIAIDWYYMERSKVRPLHDAIAMTWDVMKIRWRYLLGQYREK